MTGSSSSANAPNGQPLLRRGAITEPLLDARQRLGIKEPIAAV